MRHRDEIILCKVISEINIAHDMLGMATLEEFLNDEKLKRAVSRTVINIAEERPNAEQICFIEQVIDYVVENGYINNVLDLMKAPFDRPYKFSVIFTREEQIKFVQVINSIKSNALIA